MNKNDYNIRLERKEESDFTVRAGLLTLLSTASAITDCLTVRMHRSFYAESWYRDILTE